MVRLTHRTATGTTERQKGHDDVDIKKTVIYIVLVFVLYTIITSPIRAAEMVQVGFEGVSSAAKGVGEFMTGLIS